MPNEGEIVRREDSTLSKLEKAVERLTGRKAEDLRATPLAELREQMEQSGIKVHIRREGSFVGRGNIMSDRIVDHDEVERLFLESMR